MTTRDDARSPLFAIFAIIGFVAFGFLSFHFLKLQNIWIDESTQLSGMTLPPHELLAWLSGVDLGRFGVPGDRMPPISYLVDHVGYLAFGNPATNMRILHWVITLMGLAVLTIAVRRSFGRGAALFALAMLVLSPKLIEASVEIRAYPLFFTEVCIMIALFLDLYADWNATSGKKLFGFFACGLVTIYTHFFGLVALSAMTAALGLRYLNNPSAIVRIVVGYGIVGLLFLGILPFASGAVAMSQGPVIAEPRSLLAVATYFPRVLAASVNMVSPLSAILFFAGWLTLAIIAVASPLMRDGRQALRAPAVGLLIALIAGLAATVLAYFVTDRFEPLKPSYSIWALPMLAVIAAAGVAELNFPAAWTRWFRDAGIASTLAGAALASVVFFQDGRMFVHGPQKALDRMIDEAGPSTAVVYEQGAEWAWGYFPLRYTRGTTLAQWRSDKTGPHQIVALGWESLQPPTDVSALRGYHRLVVVNIATKTFRDIRRFRDGAPTGLQPVVISAALAKDGWKLVRTQDVPGLYSASLSLYER
ncbi:MAG: hypothetical protein QM780_07350 [Hyphomicrobium sp.]|uniref:hypothetical protein n=1 Tax=Hyphomicrobium sp. TaxID=82 RepID=UPI0039E30B82